MCLLPTPNVEEYLEAIYVLTVETRNAYTSRVAQYLGVSVPSVTQAMRRLQRDGLVEVGGERGLHLTAHGHVEAERVVRRHRLAERWAHDVLGLDWIQAHEEASHLEHALTPLIEQRLWESLGRPTTCPHGNPIPGLAPVPDPEGLGPMADLSPGERAVIDRIFEQVEGLTDFLRYLADTHLVPGAEVQVLECTDDSMACRIDGGPTCTIPLDAARRLLVRRNAPALP